MRWLAQSCSFGDLIRVRLGAVCHYGIFASEDEVLQFALPPIAAYADREKTVCATDIETFACGQIVETAVLDAKEKKKRRSPEQTVAAARARLGEGGYDLIHNNCEHFATACIFGEARCAEEEEARRRWRSRPILNVYLLRVAENTDPERIASSARRKALRGRKNPGLAAEGTAAWIALEYGLTHALGLDPAGLRFHCDRFGKWSCREAGFSLTHNGVYAAAAVSNAPVGVDLEDPAAFAAKHGPETVAAMADRALLPEERSAVRGAETFLRMWTRKESTFKCSGSGHFQPLAVPVSASSQCYALPSEGLLLAVCGANSAALRVFLLEDGAARPIAARLLREDEPCVY